MADFRWQRGSGDGPLVRFVARPDGMRAANDSRAAGARGGAGAGPPADILAPFLPDAPAELVELAAHRSGRARARPPQSGRRRSRT